MKTYDDDDICTVIVSRILAESAKAFKCLFQDGEIIWLPKSQVDRDADIHDTNVEVSMPFWLCEKNGLENFIQD